MASPELEARRSEDRPTRDARPAAGRLRAIREELGRQGLDGFVVPHSDENLSEYVPAHARRLAWLTGFSGSTGTAIVLRDSAALFVDGRYTLQARAQVEPALWQPMGLVESDPVQWLGAMCSDGMRIGYDPWLHSVTWVARAEAAVASKRAQLVPVAANPVDRVWPGQPPRGTANAIFVHPLEHAGVGSEDKRAAIARQLRSEGRAAVVLTALDSIAWLLNIRGDDVARTPVTIGYAILHDDARADLFVPLHKVDEAVRTHLGDDVRIHDLACFAPALSKLGGVTVAIDPARTTSAISRLLAAGGSNIVFARDPALLPKAVKNAREIMGHRAAQRRDGIALCKFLYWLAQEALQSPITEIEAANKLEDLRRQSGKLHDLAFDTISAAGAHGAIIHYRPDQSSNCVLEPGSLYLVDSGGQYRDGTTDVTRTVAIGSPSPEMRARYTEVLKGLIALTTVQFPVGTHGGQLDTLARQFLWRSGFDYPYGTGHGVGSFLSGHEGPQRIAHAGEVSEPMQPGMIVSNEPGYYKAGSFGLRIENLMLVIPRSIPGADAEILGFETLTFAPLDRSLIAVELLSSEERDWVNVYHAKVWLHLNEDLTDDEALWLSTACAPI